MQTANYQKNTAKAAQAEQMKDFPMAAVYWNNAANSPCTSKQRHWAECRFEHCSKEAGKLDG